MFLGLDAGKSTHHGHGLTPAGRKVFDRPLPNSEPKLRAVFDKLTARPGRGRLWDGVFRKARKR